MGGTTPQAPRPFGEFFDLLHRSRIDDMNIHERLETFWAGECEVEVRQLYAALLDSFRRKVEIVAAGPVCVGSGKLHRRDFRPQTLRGIFAAGL